MSDPAAAPSPVPASRISVLAKAEVNRDASYVLYWMTAARRARHNFAL